MNARRLGSGIAVASLLAMASATGDAQPQGAPPYDGTFLEGFEDFTAGPFGVRDEHVEGYPCANTPPYGQDLFVSCEITDDPGNHCRDAVHASNDPKDCRCKYHVGAAAFEHVRCNVIAHFKTWRPPPPPRSCKVASGPFGFSCNGPLPNMTCISVNVPSTPAAYTWGDDYFCWNPGGLPPGMTFQWSTSGPLPGQRCLPIREPAEPKAYGWDSTFLCVNQPLSQPQRPYLQWEWVYNGTPDAQYSGCVSWWEPLDPHTWGDNELCWALYTPQPHVLLADLEDFTASPVGDREDKTVGDACGGNSYSGCAIADDHDNHCRSPHKTSADPTDCRCTFHIGASAFNHVHCAVRIGLNGAQP
jgi:hypothetical protein